MPLHDTQTLLHRQRLRPIDVFQIGIVFHMDDAASHAHGACGCQHCEDAPCEQVNRWTSYLFPDAFSPGDNPDVARLGPESRAALEDFASALGAFVTRSSVFAILAEGRVA